MKTLVLNTLGNDYTEQIKALIKDKEIEIVDTSGMKIAHCMGCNQCWLKTPGICAIKDDYEEIIKKLVETENLWIVSDTRFGFLDYKGKRLALPSTQHRTPIQRRCRSGDNGRLVQAYGSKHRWTFTWR